MAASPARRPSRSTTGNTAHAKSAVERQALGLGPGRRVRSGHELAQVASSSGAGTPTWRQRPHFGQNSVAGPSSARRSTVTHTESERRPGQESPDAVRTSGTPSRGEAGPATHLRCPDFPLPLLSCAKRQRMIRCLPTVGRDSFHGAHRVSHDVIPKPVGISCRRSQEQRRFGNLLGGASGRTHFVGSYLDAPPRGIPACTETPVRENRIRTGKIHRPGEGFKCRINRLVPRRARSDGGGVQAEHWF